MTSTRRHSDDVSTHHLVTQFRDVIWNVGEGDGTASRLRTAVSGARIPVRAVDLSVLPNVPASSIMGTGVISVG